MGLDERRKQCRSTLMSSCHQSQVRLVRSGARWLILLHYYSIELTSLSLLASAPVPSSEFTPSIIVCSSRSLVFHQLTDPRETKFPIHKQIIMNITVMHLSTILIENLQYWKVRLSQSSLPLQKTAPLLFPCSPVVDHAQPHLALRTPPLSPT